MSSVCSLEFFIPLPNQDGAFYNQNQVTGDQCVKEQLLHAIVHNISVLEVIHLVCNIYGNVLQEHC